MFSKSSLACILSIAMTCPLTTFAVDFSKLNNVPACASYTPSSNTKPSGPCNGIIIFENNSAIQDQTASIQSMGASIRHTHPTYNAASVYIPNATALTNLLQMPGVTEIMPDRIMSIITTAEDLLGISSQSSIRQITPAGIARIGASPGKLSYQGQGVGIGIIDTGIDLTNADLHVSPTCFSGIYGTCNDDNGHGTHVSGIAAAINNTIDVVGVAPASTVYSVKVLNSAGSGTDSDVIAGLEWVAANATTVVPAIRVVNLSLGRTGTLNDNPLLRAAFQTLEAMGIVAVVAAGNDPSITVSQFVPATYPEVMAITSTTALAGTNSCRSFTGVIQADTASYYSTEGAFNATTKIGVTMSAPGEQQENVSRTCYATSIGIPSLKRGGGILSLSGTSMSTPHVTGVTALLIEQNPSLTLEGVRTIIRNDAFRIGVAPLDSPTKGYVFDGQREGILSACQSLGESCT